MTDAFQDDVADTLLEYGLKIATMELLLIALIKQTGLDKSAVQSILGDLNEQLDDEQQQYVSAVIDQLFAAAGGPKVSH